MNIMIGCEYYLYLFNGQCWRLTASGDASLLLKKMAQIMRLGSDGQDCKRLSFIKCDPGTSDYEAYIPDDLPKKGWIVKKYNPVRLLYHNKLPDIICNIGTGLTQNEEYVSMDCALIPIIEQVIRTKGAVFHSGLIVRDGCGVLLMAPSGVGKSTCCRRVSWPWKAWCDDHLLLVLGEDGWYHAHPLPTWVELIAGGKDMIWDVQAHVPVKAIFLLEQSERDEVIPINSVMAALAVYNSALRGCMNIHLEEDDKYRADSRGLIFNNVCDMLKKIPTFTLRVSKDGKFWEEIESVL